jgi:hypothetical protein
MTGTLGSDKTGITYQTSSLLKRAREATYMRAKVTKLCLLDYLTMPSGDFVASDFCYLTKPAER